MTVDQRQTLTIPASAKATSPASPRPSRIAKAWLALLFFFARVAPWVLALMRPIAVWISVFSSRPLRDNIARNARWIFGREPSRREARRFARGVVASFYDFVADVGRSGTGKCAEDFLRRLRSDPGREGYLQARQSRRGAILVTAHLGAFEVGLAALRQVEKDVHVVFKRDAFADFERIRSRVRGVLGVHEAPIDDGFASLTKLRDALLADQVVVMQADRAMPGQRSQVVPFLHGHLRLPIGPVRLAELTGSPIVPVFVVPIARGRFDVHLCEPIHVNPNSEPVDGVDPALLKIAKAIESFVAPNPKQWLVLEPVFVEDESRGRAGGQRE
jgi:KDO2-lipid IV(A) lauroyltransferase